LQLTIQFLPAVLALNLGVVLLLIALTWIFGRVYCSVICPLGIFQDVVSPEPCMQRPREIEKQQGDKRKTDKCSCKSDRSQHNKLFFR